MRMMYKLVLFMVCLNMGTYMINYVAGLNDMPIMEGVNPVVEPDDFAENFNATQTVDAWTSFTSQFSYIGDVVGGLVMMWNSVKMFFDGFPYMLENMGVPTVIVNGLRSIYFFMFAWSLFEWISGRRASQ